MRLSAFLRIGTATRWGWRARRTAARRAGPDPGTGREPGQGGRAVAGRGDEDVGDGLTGQDWAHADSGLPVVGARQVLRARDRRVDLALQELAVGAPGERPPPADLGEGPGVLVAACTPRATSGWPTRSWANRATSNYPGWASTARKRDPSTGAARSGA